MMKNWLAAGAIALTAGMTTTVAQAQSTTVPGEQVGLATGAPLPEGIYAINTFTYRSPDGPDALRTDTAVNIPVLAWATPYQPLGGRLTFLVAPPTVFTFSRAAGGRDTSINVGTFVGGLWAFDLGSNVGVSILGGSYLNELNGGRGLNQLASNTYRVGGAISYTGDGYNLTANLTYNFYDSPARFEGRNGIPAFFGPVQISDAFNLDLTATKKFGKFEIGAIGYGTVNLDPNLLATPFSLDPVRAGARIGRGGRFALGGLIGYDFGPFTVQAYVARDVVTSAGLPESTDGWFRIIAPLYTPAAAVAPAPAPLVRKY